MRNPRLGWLGLMALTMASVPGVAGAAPGDTTLVSVRQSGLATAMGPSASARLSANGRFVAFRSAALDLAPGNTGGRVHGYVTDLATGTVERVSVSSSKAVANSDTDSLAISRDGRFVAFASIASNLVQNDTNGVGDVFVRDRQSGLTQRVSVSSSGAQGARASFAPCISGDGRYVAFGSRAANLVTGDTNGVDDILVRDRQTGQTRRISVANNGAQGNGSSFACNFSADGRFVVFTSRATNLVAGDTNAGDDVFVRDLLANATERVSVNSAGVQANQGVRSLAAALSDDGRFVAFSSGSSNLVPGDTNDSEDIFVRDRQADLTERVSVNSSGLQMSSGSFAAGPVLSANGRFVAFYAAAPNLAPGGDGSTAIYVRDRQNAATTRVSVKSDGTTGNSYSLWPSISADGRYVAFESAASDLVPGDGNGATDVFVRDRQAAALLVASRPKVASHAAGSDLYLECCDETLTGPAISDDGRFVAFVSTADSLVVDGSTVRRVSAAYVRDVPNRRTIRVDAAGTILNGAVISGSGRYVIFTDFGSGGFYEWDRLTGDSRLRVPTGDHGARVSDDGRFLVFPSYGALLTADTNDTTDIYVHDRQSGAYSRVSVSSNGVQANSYSEYPEVSGDGRFVVFVSDASNLVTGDTNAAWDVFVRDRVAGRTERVSVGSSGTQANGSSYAPSISDDGRFVAFSSYASNLVAGDTNARADLYVRDRQTGQTQRIVLSGEAVPNGKISADGRYLTLTSPASLIPGDTNGTGDVYVVDRSTGRIELMSQSSNGTQANGPSDQPSMSGNGRFVVFNTRASNLGGKDLNGLTDVYLRERAVSSLTVAPLALSFGRQAVNTTSAAQIVRVTNVSSAAVPITSVAVQGTNAGQFARTHKCGSSLASGASCTIDVVFKPTSTGTKSATLNVNGSGGGLRSVALSGTGIAGS